MVAKADDSGTCGNNLTWTYVEATKTLTISGSGAMWDYDYSDLYESPWTCYHQSMERVTIESGVTSIGDDAFYGCSGLTSITIPEGVTSIGYQALKNCSNLTSIIIPNSVRSIGEEAFSSCSCLTSIIVESGNRVYDSRSDCNAIIKTKTNELILGCKNTIIPNSVTTIERYAFEGCSDLTSITIPNSVTTIGDEAFWGCSSLTSIKVESGNRVYDSRSDCNAIIKKENNELIVGCKNTIIPNSVRSIGWGAFEGCSGLTSITIPNSVTSIGRYAFLRCSNLSSITIPNSVTSIGDFAFNYCSGLTSIIVESGNRVYDSRNDCNAIIKTGTNELIVGCKNTIIPNSVKSIGWAAFWGCSDLTSITIPNSVTSIGNGAFAYCPKLADVYCYTETLPSTYSNAFDGSNIESSTLHVPASAIDKYRTTEPWSKFGTIIGDSPSKSYKLIYVVDGEEQGVEIMNVGATIIAKEEPTKEGYTFSGWSEIPETMPAHDVTITGTFTINQYTITYIVDDEEYQSRMVDYNSTLSLPDMPERNGYTFVWEDMPKTMPAHDITIVGHYQPNKYVVTYIVNGSTYSTEEIEFGSVITPPATDNNGNPISWNSHPTTMPSYDITIYGNSTDGIDLVQRTHEGTEFYTLDGKKVNRLQRGVNIIRRGSKVMKVKR